MSQYKPLVNVLVTGAAGNIAYSLIPMILKGDVFGANQPVKLSLVDIPGSEDRMNGFVWELEDSCYTLSRGINIFTDQKEAFKNIDYAFLIASCPYKPGMIRKDFLQQNAKIFSETGKIIDKYANKNIKILVVANPANTNCYLLMKNAPSIPRTNFSSLSRLDFNRSVHYIKSLLTNNSSISDVSYDNIDNITLWGNHSDILYPILNHVTYNNKPLFDLIQNKSVTFETMQDEYVKYVRSRAEIILNARKASTITSAALASCDHMRDWVLGSNGKVVVMGICSDGNPYGFPDDLIFAFPVICKGGNYEIVKNYPLNEENLRIIKENEKQLQDEIELAFSSI